MYVHTYVYMYVDIPLSDSISPSAAPSTLRIALGGLVVRFLWSATSTSHLLETKDLFKDNVYIYTCVQYI